MTSYRYTCIPLYLLVTVWIRKCVIIRCERIFCHGCSTCGEWGGAGLQRELYECRLQLWDININILYNVERVEKSEERILRDRVNPMGECQNKDFLERYRFAKGTAII